MFKNTDKNSDGKLSKEEIFKLLKPLVHPTDSFEAVWDRLDKNKDGFINGAEITGFISYAFDGEDKNLKLTPTFQKMILRSCDKNCDDKIIKAELFNFWNKFKKATASSADKKRQQL